MSEGGVNNFDDGINHEVDPFIASMLQGEPYADAMLSALELARDTKNIVPTVQSVEQLERISGFLRAMESTADPDGKAYVFLRDAVDELTMTIEAQKIFDGTRESIGDVSSEDVKFIGDLIRDDGNDVFYLQ